MGHSLVTEHPSGESLLKDGGIEPGILTESDIAGREGSKNLKPKGTWFGVGMVQVIVVSHIRARSVAHIHHLVGSAMVRRMGRLAKRSRVAEAHNPVIPLHRDRAPSVSNVSAFQAWLNYLLVNPVSPNSPLAIIHMQRGDQASVPLCASVPV